MNIRIFFLIWWWNMCKYKLGIGLYGHPKELRIAAPAVMIQQLASSPIPLAIKVSIVLCWKVKLMPYNSAMMISPPSPLLFTFSFVWSSSFFPSILYVIRTLKCLFTVKDAVCAWTSGFVCKWGREIETEREREGEREGKTKRQCVCVCVYSCMSLCMGVGFFVCVHTRACICMCA